MTLSIIIPTFNRCDILRGLLTMLHSDEVSKTAMEYEIIVVDDQSKDNTWKIVSTEFPAVKLLRGPGHDAEQAKRGAVEASVGDYIVCLDDDCLPRPGWLKGVQEDLNRGEKIVQCKLVFHDLGQKELQDESRKYFRSGFRADMMPLAILNGGYRPQYIMLCHEFGCFFSREVLKKVPLDDPNLIVDFGPSASFSLRARKYGYRVFFEPASVIDHLGATSGGLIDRVKKQAPKKNCNEYTTKVVHNFMVFARMYRPLRIPFLIPYYIAGGLYLSIKQRKNCLKYFSKGLIGGLTKQFKPVIPYGNL
ncbi:MAG: glycosyltransferase family 2 protein [Candidatus Kapaibacterium sp.]